jgi:mycoredoxin
VWRSWRLAALALAAGLIVAAVQFATGGYVLGAIELAVFVALAASWSPLAFPRSPGLDRARQDGRPVIFWRPGCTYCQRLRIRLGRDGRRAHWVNIWADPAAAAAVRAITGGDETVPTVELNGQPHVNPDPGWLRDRLRVERDA